MGYPPPPSGNRFQDHLGNLICPWPSHPLQSEGDFAGPLEGSPHAVMKTTQAVSHRLNSAFSFPLWLIKAKLQIQFGDTCPAIPASHDSSLEATSRPIPPLGGDLTHPPDSFLNPIPVPGMGEEVSDVKEPSWLLPVLLALIFVCFSSASYVVSLNLLSWAVLTCALLHLLSQNPVHAAALGGQQQVFVGNRECHGTLCDRWTLHRTSV